MIELDWHKPGRTTLTGAPEGYDAAVLADLARRAPDGFLQIVRDDARMAALAEALAFFAPDLDPVLLPAWDCLPYDRIGPNPEIAARRAQALGRLAAGGTRLVIATVNAVLQRVPPASAMAGTRFAAKVGAPIDAEALKAFLARNGYARSDTVTERGEFALRGGLIDLFPPGAEEPLRLDLFGETLDSIRRFDPLTQRTTGKLREFELRPAGELWLDADSIARFRAGYRAAFGAVTDDDPLYAAISAGRRHIGMEHWLPLFHERLESVFDYLPKAAIGLDHLAEQAAEERFKTVADYYQARLDAPKLERQVAGTAYRPLAPERLYVGSAGFAAALTLRPVLAFSAFDQPGARDAGARPGRGFAAERAEPGVNLFDLLIGHAKALQGAGKRVVLASPSAGSRERLAEVLGEHGLAGLAPVANWVEAERLPPAVMGHAVLELEHGFVTESAAVIAEADVLGDRLSRPGRRARRAENFISELTTLSQGDLVVHIDHGIGRYEGLRTVEIGGAPHDCLTLIYDGGDKLLLPVENLEMLSRYGGAEGTAALDKLGGIGWQNRKARLKQRIREIADQLLKLAAKRLLRPAEALAPPAGLYDEFRARFAYEETEDQKRAIDEVLGDLAAGRPMDRLVCGDVGFGKTEVALRAAFIAVMAGRQVAVVVPTTLLARQHFRVFRERFQGLPVRIAQLSRLVSAKDQAAAKAALAEGQVDIVVGTHALLSKSIRFKDLALLVVDEEQHFGVVHKERLKELRADVHVLTLTATPIPRTLQQALTGIRELSMIATPPVDRLAVRSYVMPWDPVVMREALLREHYRGGQSFVVAPRIEDLTELTERLRALTPELKLVMAHGRMAAGALEAAMTAFYDGRYDVLVSTNIVESGLDIPRANTLIVHRSDLFGLAQLYQLRGRVGRSKRRAYAYFTLPPGRALGETAEKRLAVLQSLDQLGAGFALASHDMDIRGAGNLLGDEQSGHIREVGFELYQDMLQQAVAEAKAAERGGGGGAGDGGEQWSPQIGLGLAVLIPEAYVADLSVRMGLYRRLARLESEAEIEAFAAELIDRFGPLPAEVKDLLAVLQVKLLCRRAGIDKLEAGPKGAVLGFRGNRFADPAGLVRLIAAEPERMKLRPDHKLVAAGDWPDAPARLQGAKRLLQRIVKLAEGKGPAAFKAKA
ncbi:MAG: transcription-repair coupling factor [Alphaproteobacteria bacterium]|nr:transcription-repair coupling factor [Alphaproteobacteria bacterium]